MVEYVLAKYVVVGSIPITRSMKSVKDNLSFEIKDGKLETLRFQNMTYSGSVIFRKQSRLQLRDKIKRFLGDRANDAEWEPLMDLLNRG